MIKRFPSVPRLGITDLPELLTNVYLKGVSMIIYFAKLSFFLFLICLIFYLRSVRFGITIYKTCKRFL